MNTFKIVLFRLITLLLLIEAPHYAVLSSLLLPLLHVSKIHLFSSAPRSNSVGSLSTTRNHGDTPIIYHS
jgi:hypothetical protein